MSEEATATASTSTDTSNHHRVGYALAPKKIESFVQDSLLRRARERGIDLVPVDLTKPLQQQGPFDCLIHKLYDPQWKAQLDEFSALNPSVLIIDPLPAIERLHNRISMLQVVNQLSIPTDLLGIPEQVFVHDDSQSILDSVTRQGLEFPVISKPLVADGSAKSHQMCLVFNPQGLQGLSPPVVLQEFINHGGVIFKVYVAGKHVKCVKRRSLPDISDDKLGISGNLLPFSQISNLTAHDRDQNEESLAKLIEEAEMPPPSFVTQVANELRRSLRLHLFNFDMIRDSRAGNRYLVIDINYFPGYAKMPSYETVLTDFFLDIVHRKQSELSGLAREEAQQESCNNQETVA